MRLRHPDGTTLHLAYCTNVHAQEDPADVREQVLPLAGRVRAELDVDVLGVGLWLPATAAATLRAWPGELAALRAALAAQQLEVVTLNGFPYGGFHAPVVKREVYRPDWAHPDRLRATLDMAWVLARLLPDDVAEGTISTLPLGWAPWVPPTRLAAARTHLAALDEGLARLADATGRTVRVGLEPEPGCVLGRAVDVVEEVAALDLEHVVVALDACHLAVEFEDPAEVAARLRATGRRAAKLQVANALSSPAGSRADHAARLGQYVEPRFLHQTRVAGGDGVRGTDDLDEALAGGLPAGAGEWRSHVHVPVHRGPGTTQHVLEQVLDEVVGGPTPLTTHLEVETYTWSTLPEGQRPTDDDGLVAALAAELRWTADALRARGCAPLHTTLTETP